MENRDFQILKKILLEIDVLEEMIKGFDLKKFIEDERTKRAVCMTLQNDILPFKNQLLNIINE